MYIPRELEPAVRKHLERKEYTVITGARQTGKTTLLKHLYREVKSGRPAFYLSFEDVDILTRINRHPEELFAFVPRPEGEKIYVFIDEIQYAANPTNFLKYLFDTYGDRIKVVATGSSAFYMDDKFKDSLAGRKRIFELKTLNFREWLLFQREDEMLAELDLIRRHPEYISPFHRRLTALFDEFAVFGGYPRVALEEDPDERMALLKELKNAFLKRDITETGVEQTEKFYQLFTLLAGQTGNLLNRNELASILHLSHKTVDRYLTVLQKTFHIALVRPFYANVRKELTKMPKIYFKDNGMRNVLLNRFYPFRNRDDNGALFENYIYRRLTDLYDAEQIRFWRTADGKEIDFVVTRAFGEGTAYEVKLSCPRKKERALEVFRRAYPGYTVQTVTYENQPPCLWFLKLEKNDR